MEPAHSIMPPFTFQRPNEIRPFRDEIFSDGSRSLHLRACTDVLLSH